MMSALLLIIIVFTIIATIAIAAVGPFITRRLSLKANLSVICSYLVLLLAFSVISCAIPSSALMEAIDPIQSVEYFETGGTVIASGIREGTFEAPAGFVKTEASFDVPSEHVVISRAEDVSSVIYVGTKGVDAPDNGTDAIDVYSYVTGYINIADDDYTIQADPPTAELTDGVLTILPAKQRSLQLISFNDRMMVPQFFDSVQNIHGGGSFGYLAVVVLLPPGVTYSGSGTEPLSALLSPTN
jgi:hypothetical protein